jgi:hypothetical protein
MLAVEATANPTPARKGSMALRAGFKYPANTYLNRSAQNHAAEEHLLLIVGRDLLPSLGQMSIRQVSGGRQTPATEIRTCGEPQDLFFPQQH